jgi:nitroimidazol reductase NimA-like FMN-containing flavoprotein (pyridoxamine 5'-phosphate oxidase superfamily)
MGDTGQAKARLRELLSSQLFCVLATQDRGQPYGNLVAFVATDDLSGLVFATSRNTRKYGNIVTDPRVAMLVDSRSNQGSDIGNAVAATALGTVEEVQGDDRERLVALYLAKHPHLEEFVSSPDCAMLTVKIDRYYLVSEFQKVTELSVPD